MHLIMLTGEHKYGQVCDLNSPVCGGIKIKLAGNQRLNVHVAFFKKQTLKPFFPEELIA